MVLTSLPTSLRMQLVSYLLFITGPGPPSACLNNAECCLASPCLDPLPLLSSLWQSFLHILQRLLMYTICRSHKGLHEMSMSLSQAKTHSCTAALSTCLLLVWQPPKNQHCTQHHLARFHDDLLRSAVAVLLMRPAMRDSAVTWLIPCGQFMLSCAEVQAAKPAHNDLQTCLKSFPSPTSIFELGQGAWPACVE